VYFIVLSLLGILFILSGERTIKHTFTERPIKYTFTERPIKYTFTERPIRYTVEKEQ
jgi:YHS domain-containing protein